MRPLLAASALFLCLAATAISQSTPAGTSFVGTIVRVERVEQSALPRVRIMLRLTAPEIAAGHLVAFEEWDGLWMRADRYRVGQSVALTLYPASALGLTSKMPAAASLAGSATRARSRTTQRRIPPRPDRRRGPRVE